jgi:hypothetical protein
MKRWNVTFFRTVLLFKSEFLVLVYYCFLERDSVYSGRNMSTFRGSYCPHRQAQRATQRFNKTLVLLLTLVASLICFYILKKSAKYSSETIVNSYHNTDHYVEKTGDIKYSLQSPPSEHQERLAMSVFSRYQTSA